MALAHACIAVFPHPLLSRGETGEKVAEEARVQEAAREQETEEEEDAGGRVVDVARAKVMGISFSRVCRLRVYLFFSGIRRRAFFRGPRSALSRFSIRPFTRIAERASLSKVYYNRSREERIVLEMILFLEILRKRMHDSE